MIYFTIYQCTNIDHNALLALLIYLNQVCLVARFLHCKMRMNIIMQKWNVSSNIS